MRRPARAIEGEGPQRRVGNLLAVGPRGKGLVATALGEVGSRRQVDVGQRKRRAVLVGDGFLQRAASPRAIPCDGPGLRDLVVDAGRRQGGDQHVVMVGVDELRLSGGEGDGDGPHCTQRRVDGRERNRRIEVLHDHVGKAVECGRRNAGLGLTDRQWSVDDRRAARSTKHDEKSRVFGSAGTTRANAGQSRKPACSGRGETLQCTPPCDLGV